MQLRIRKKLTVSALLVLLLCIVVVFWLPRASTAAPGTLLIEEKAIRLAPVQGLPPELRQLSVNVYRISALQKPRAVLVLVSGWTCGAAWLHYVAAYLARNFPLEIWTVNRVPAQIELRSKFDQLMQKYNKGELAGSRLRSALRDISDFSAVPLSSLSDYGLFQYIRDFHQVIVAARKKAVPVFAGGWSDGVEHVMLYAQMAFASGRRGHTFLRGLVFLDENAQWSLHSREKMKTMYKNIQNSLSARPVETRSPNVLLHEAAARAKDGRLASAFSRRPHKNRAYTKKALLGWLYDGGGKYSRFSWLFQCGEFALDGNGANKAGWRSPAGEPSSIERIIAMHTKPGGMWEWFYPRKMAADYWLLGARAFRIPEERVAPDRSNRLPVFAVFSQMNRFSGAVPSGLRYYMGVSGISRQKMTIRTFFHLKHGDILIAPEAGKKIWSPLGTWLVQHARY